MNDKERKQIPLIPGVSRGGDYFRGRSVEMGGQKLAAKHRIEYGEIPLDLYLIKLNQAEYLSLPFLGRDDVNAKLADFWEPRVDPLDGSVITWRWEKPNVEKRDFLYYIPFSGKRVNDKFNFGDIPQGWTVGVLVPQRVKEGIEAAMRQQDEVAHDYRRNYGPEADRVTETFDFIYEASSAFVMGDVKDENDLNAIARLAEDHFKVHGLLDSEDSIWQKVVSFTQKAAEKDRLNRVNPLVSRVRVRAAFLAATEREMVARSIGTKAEKVYRRLSLIRSGIRLRIKTAIDVLDDLCAFSAGKVAQDPIMREGNLTCTAREGWELEQYLKIISGDVLRGIQPAPYLVPVVSARVILSGENCFKNNKERIAGINILKNSYRAGLLNDSAVSKLRSGDPLAAREKMFRALLWLKEILEDPRTTDIRVFDR